MTTTDEIKLFTTCPTYDGADSNDYTRRVCSVSRWSDEAGCKGMLIYTDNSVVDPWLISQLVLQNTDALSPLVAVQSAYMHPFTVAKMVSSLSYLYGRQMCLNVVAGGFKNDLAALNDLTPHDKRYERLIEYTTIIQRLLAGGPVTFEGAFYRVEKLRLQPPLPKELFPIITISGSSAAGLAAAESLGAIPIKYPEPPEQCTVPVELQKMAPGIRVGIIAREREQQAWEVADARFPPDREGQLKHSLSMKVSDSVWHRTLSDLSSGASRRSTYWLWPFQNYKTFCPYLVGSYRQVADVVEGYLAAGYRTFILDVPASQEDLNHTKTVFEHARRTVCA